jgi:hypothetical protein
MKNELKLFENHSVRSVWDSEKEKWYFSIVDVVAILTCQTDQLKARKYWNKLRERLSSEGNETATNRYQLKIPARDGSSSTLNSIHSKQKS